ncbi:MAG: hypothetical protein ACLPID_08025 [Beijerinckiaceae bacterium]
METNGSEHPFDDLGLGFGDLRLHIGSNARDLRLEIGSNARDLGVEIGMNSREVASNGGEVVFRRKVALERFCDRIGEAFGLFRRKLRLVPQSANEFERVEGDGGHKKLLLSQRFRAAQ